MLSKLVSSLGDYGEFNLRYRIIIFFYELGSTFSLIILYFLLLFKILFFFLNGHFCLSAYYLFSETRKAGGIVTGWNGHNSNCKGCQGVLLVIIHYGLPLGVLFVFHSRVCWYIKLHGGIDMCLPVLIFCVYGNNIPS